MGQKSPWDVLASLLPRQHLTWPRFIGLLLFIGSLAVVGYGAWSHFQHGSVPSASVGTTDQRGGLSIAVGGNVAGDINFYSVPTADERKGPTAAATVANNSLLPAPIPQRHNMPHPDSAAL